MGPTTTTTFHTLINFLNQPSIIETFVDILLCSVPIWAAVIIGLVIGWSWRPRWTGLVFLGFRTKLRFLWTAPPGFGARRVWFAFTALSAFSVLGTLWSRFRGKNDDRVESVPDLGAQVSDTRLITPEGENDIVTESDLKHLFQLLEGKDGEISWQPMMERSTSNMTYKAWRHEPENGPTIYRSQTVFEDSTPELVRDFFWDDEFRPKWDPMLTYFKILEECPQTGTMVVHWIKKFPFFCSDREYIIGRRIWEAGKAYYCITKGVPYQNLPKRDRPRRVEQYFSSWIIMPVKSVRDGQMSACEVSLVHYEDMGIPKDVAKLGVRHGMWGTVKKLHAGMRAYENAQNSEAPLSRCGLMARMTTKISCHGLPGEEDVRNQTSDSLMCTKTGIDWKWIVLGGTVAVVCGLHTGVIGKALMIGAGRRIARK
ncbi:hypothetical protein RND81_14G031400 [Saponaria officinalis]|uniref:START domain-containing protein n=1 Tax=Saponaria officinalis TaxID=3572 RepID=A0AAW1GIS5_SAPOF